ncbi:MAG: glycosyltransferase family 2 protein [Candidatus Moranbacteria bacterium]|nr:glycosyltransferase family 2 protein [Candidatus Moranbacteria bacterium]NTW45535.1 glycosyltransferase family 2 protein [Candidatus Moranbacteria bacterium]
MSPKISIAINSYRNPELLRLCLDSVFRHVQRDDFEVLVVDSATEEATRLVLKDYPQVRTFVPHERNVGFPVLLNRSLKEARGEFLFLINHDIILTEGSVDELLRFAESDPKIGIVGPRQVNFNGSEQISCFRFYRPWTIVYRRTFLGKLPFAKRHLDWFLMRDYDRKTPRNVDWVMGSALFVRREAVDAVGLMDTRFFMYMEDVDWCRRFWDAGFRVVHYPDVTVYHYHGKGSAKGGFLRSLLLNRLTWYHISSGAKYFLKYLGKPLPKHD